MWRTATICHGLVANMVELDKITLYSALFVVPLDFWDGLPRFGWVSEKKDLGISFQVLAIVGFN